MADELAAWTGPGHGVVDHINNNRLDNRRCNLRVVTHSQNIAMDTFNDEEDAAHAYDDDERAEFGECACLNYVREGEISALLPQHADEP